MAGESTEYEPVLDGEKVETKDGQPEYDFQYWNDQIKLAGKGVLKFHQRGRKTLRRYTDTRGSGDDLNRKVNLFWSNTGVLKSALYAQPPEPTVKRQWDDFNDDIGRVAATIMERLLKLGLQRPRGDMDCAFDYATQDRLIPGLGQVWLRYTVETEQREIELEGATEPLTYEEIVDEDAVTDYIHWEDFLWGPCRVWEECRWVARLAHMTKEASVKRFGSEKAENLSYSDKFEKTDKVGGEPVEPKRRPEATADVWEIWNKPNKCVYWITTSGVESLLDKKKDPLGLEGFWPCPKPLMATHTTSDMTPRPDYYMTKDQYEEIDALTTRISWLTKACKAAGVYDKTSEGIQRLFEDGVENTLIPVDNWAMFAEKGGVAGQVDWIPLEQIAATINILEDQKAKKVVELYELTGISDIMRGATNARETLGAQQLKAQYGSVRLQYLQGMQAEFVQEAMRIKADIISKHFQPETMLKKSLISMIPEEDHDKIEPAIQMIQDTPVAMYHLEVEADTMSIPDYAVEKQARMEYVTAMGQLMSQSWQALQAAPEMAPMVLKTLQWAAAGFKNGTYLEGVLDQAVDAAQEKIKKMQQQPPEPSPEEKKAQAEIALEKAKLEIKQKEAQADAQRKAQESQEGIKQDWAETNADIANEERQTTETIMNQRRNAINDAENTRIRTEAQVRAIEEKAEAQDND